MTSVKNKSNALRTDADAQRPVKANLEFGVRQADGTCVNVGICRIEPKRTAAKMEKRCKMAETHLYMTDNRNLCLFFPETGMQDCTRRAVFQLPILAVPLPCIVPEIISKKMGINELLTIPAGFYPIKRTDRGYLVSIPPAVG